VSKNDETRVAIGADWKIKCRPLNRVNMFMFNTQFYWSHIQDYPDNFKLFSEKDDNMMATGMLRTLYMNHKLEVFCAYMRHISLNSNFWRIAFTYKPDDTWGYTLGTILLNGDNYNEGFKVQTNKDHVFFKISYQWG
jgi:hypothetical protein